MIEWLQRADPDRPYLKTADRVWTYGATTGEIEARTTDQVVSLRPAPDAESVFDILAGIAGGGAMVMGPGVEAPTDADPHGAALVAFTSGTTGAPKGVRLTQSNLEAAAASSMKHLGHGEGDTWLLAMPLNHVGGLSILIRSAYAGGSVRLLPEFDPRAFSAAMKADVTMVSVVAAMLHQVLEADPGPYQGLKAVLVGGGPIPDELLERGQAAGLPVLPSYGMTETFGQVATLRPGSPLAHRAHPLPGIELEIDPYGRVVVSGDQVSPGYLGEPDRAYAGLATNDLGEIDAEGALRILGRADTVIITGGENVDPTRVETELAAQPGVEEAVVVGIPDPGWGAILVALYVGRADESELHAAMSARLPRYMVPTRWLRVAAIPRTPLGKPDRPAALALCLGDDG